MYAQANKNRESFTELTSGESGPHPCQSPLLVDNMEIKRYREEVWWCSARFKKNKEMEQPNTICGPWLKAALNTWVIKTHLGDNRGDLNKEQELQKMQELLLILVGIAKGWWLYRKMSLVSRDGCCWSPQKENVMMSEIYLKYDIKTWSPEC